MTSNIQPDDLEALLAVHALGALNGDDLEIVEHALATDGNARSEHARFTQATQLLDSPSGPRPEVWDAIVRAIDSDHRAVVMPIGASRRSSARGIRRRFVRTMGIAAAIGAALAVAAWGVEQVAQSSPAPTPNVQQAARAAARADGARRVVLTTGDGASATLVLLPNRLGYVLNGTLPAALRGSSYRLFGVTDQGNVELAEIGRRIVATEFQLPAGVTALVLERGTAANGRRIASQPVSAPDDGAPAHKTNTGGGSTTTPKPSTPVTVPAPSLSPPTLPGLLGR